MSRHPGFQRTFLNDLYYVEEQLQAYDEHLYLMWNPSNGQHLIMDGLLDIAVMRIPQPGFPVLSSRVVEHMKRIHTANGFSASAVIEENERRREKEIEWKTNDIAENFARDTLKFAKRAALYG